MQVWIITDLADLDALKTTMKCQLARVQIDNIVLICASSKRP